MPRTSNNESIELKHVYLRVKDVGEDGTISGYGSVFGVVDSYGDIVVKGAFAKTLAERADKARLLWQHRSDSPIGKFTDLHEDANGLHFTASLNLKVQRGLEAYEHLKHGDIDGMSIGFVTMQDEVDTANNNVRLIKEAKLYEISLVTFPANEEATVTSVKSREGSIADRFEKLTHEQRLEVLSAINRFEAPLAGTEPPIPEASVEKHSVIEEPAVKTSDEPLEDQELLHSLNNLRQLMKG